MSRRLRQSSRTAEAEVNLTPMLDVVFILLIFFIVTAVFITEHAIGLEPPPQQTAKPTVPQPAIIVEIDADRLVRVNGRLSHIEGVQANLQRLQVETSAQAVIIQAHPKTPNGLVIRLRDQIAGADIQQVNLVLSDI